MSTYLVCSISTIIISLRTYFQCSQVYYVSLLLPMDFVGSELFSSTTQANNSDDQDLRDSVIRISIDVITSLEGQELLHARLICPPQTCTRPPPCFLAAPSRTAQRRQTQLVGIISIPPHISSPNYMFINLPRILIQALYRALLLPLLS